jgi:hypothetical protein
LSSRRGGLWRGFEKAKQFAGDVALQGAADLGVALAGGAPSAI